MSPLANKRAEIIELYPAVSESPHNTALTSSFIIQSPAQIAVCSISQSINQSINHSIDLSINWSINQSLFGGVTVRASDLRSSGRGFDSRPGRYRATQVYSAFHPSGVGRINRVPTWSAGVMAGCVHFCRLAGNTA